MSIARHVHTQSGRVPPLSTIKAMSPEAIYATLKRGDMKAQAEGLSTPQIVALIKYIAPTGGKRSHLCSRRHARPARIFDSAPTCRNGTAGART